MESKLIDRNKMKALRDAIDMALVSVAQAHGLEKLYAGSGSFSPSSGSFHFKVEGIVSGRLSSEASRLSMYARSLHLPPLGTKMVIGKKTMTVTGLNSSNTKVLAHGEDGKTYAVPISVASGFGE